MSSSNLKTSFDSHVGFNLNRTMKRELSPDPSGVGGEGGALLGVSSADARDSKVQRTDGHDVERVVGHDALVDREPSIASPSRVVANVGPSTALSPTTTSAQIAARVMAAQAEEARWADVDTGVMDTCAANRESLVSPEPRNDEIAVVVDKAEIAQTKETPTRAAELAPGASHLAPAATETHYNFGEAHFTKPEPAQNEPIDNTDTAAEGGVKSEEKNLLDTTELENEKSEKSADKKNSKTSDTKDQPLNTLNSLDSKNQSAAGLPKDPHLRWRYIQNDPDPFVKNVLGKLRTAESTEPYHQVGNDWRRQPWDTNPYETIGPGYVRAGDMPALDAQTAETKLKTSLPDGWMDLPPEPVRVVNPSTELPRDETPCLVCGAADDEASFVLCELCPKGGHFRCLNLPCVPEGDWFCHNCGGSKTPNATPTKGGGTVAKDKETKGQGDKSSVPIPSPLPVHPYVKPAAPEWKNRTPLKLNVDVEERPMWGMDCYTRVAIDAALQQVEAFAGSDLGARERRERFFSKHLMSAVHSAWEKGWDLKVSVETVRKTAEQKDNVSLIQACDAITRAIEEVDEAGLDTHPPPRPPKGQRQQSGSRSSGRNGKNTNASYVPPGVTIKRPLGAYMIYACEERANVLANHPAWSSKNISEIGKALGTGWKALSEAEKSVYQEKAKVLKKQFEEVDLPLAIKKAEDEETARVEQEALREGLAMEASAAAAAAVVAAREDRAKRRLEEAAQVAAAREDRLKKRGGNEGGDSGGDANDRIVPMEDTHAQLDTTSDADQKLDDDYDSDPQIQRYLPSGQSRRAHKRRHFRLHPKGVGVVCIRPDGIPAGTYVQDYLGELYTPWRWYERQDAIKKRDPGKELPDFFNITLERPKDDEAGVDTLFVEAAHRCTFASRLSHSCNPNCQTVVLAIDGKLTISQYTTRKIEFGEELCWNYSCVTESEKEYRAAICLCSSVRCKGAFLDFAGSSSFTAVMNRKHKFCDRNAVLIRACSEEVTDVDRKKLSEAGIKSSALNMASGSGGGEDGKNAELDTKKEESRSPRECPSWLIKWAALTLEYITNEQQLLPAALMEKSLDGITYDQGFAEATAMGVFATRITNLVVTLDKIKYVMRQPGQCVAPFLKPLTDDEVIQHLWDGPHGIFKRAVNAMAVSGTSPHALGNKGSPQRVVLDELKKKLAGDAPTTVSDAKAGLVWASSALKLLGGDHVALADVLTLYANTSSWTTPAPYIGFTSEPVVLTALPKDKEWEAKKGKEKEEGKVDGEDAKVDDALNTSMDAMDADELNASLDADLTDVEPGLDPFIDPVNPIINPIINPSSTPINPVKLAKRYKGDVTNVMSKKYQQHFAWGQLVSWFKQTIYDPSASLSADRRGTMSLPDPESAYSGSKPGAYQKSERKTLLNHLLKNSSKAWPTTWRWSFRNPAKVYGSPFIDDAIAISKGEGGKTEQVVRGMMV